jgi:hypothetical protein
MVSWEVTNTSYSAVICKPIKQLLLWINEILFFGLCVPFLWNNDATTTILAGAERMMRGRSKLVRRKCPKWLTPRCISKPSLVSPLGVKHTPVELNVNITDWRGVVHFFHISQSIYCIHLQQTCPAHTHTQICPSQSLAEKCVKKYLNKNFMQFSLIFHAF